ncbi:MAG: thiamine-phosphate kinase [Catalinimonas sp.]
MAESKRTEIQELGEFGLIERLARPATKRQASTHRGIGDDAAVLRVGDTDVVVTTDLLNEGIHFDLRYVPLEHLGYKAVVVNLSDVAAMNAVPTQITLALAVSNRFSVEALEALYAGVYRACERYDVDLVGGDTTASPAGLMLAVTAVGQAPPGRVVYRDGARPGDVVCVTGDLGGAYLGLQVLEREKKVFLADPNLQPELTEYDYVVGRQLKPEARTDVVHDLAEAGVRPTAMLDVSDGLASELLHLCKASGVGVLINEEQVPVTEETGRVADEFRLNATVCALNGGEDYELLFTVSADDYRRHVERMADVVAVGVVREAEQGALLLTRGGQTQPLRAQGWAHFAG